MILLGLGLFAVCGIYTSCCSWLRSMGNNGSSIVDSLIVYMLGALSVSTLTALIGGIGYVVVVPAVIVIAYGMFSSNFKGETSALSKPLDLAFNAIANVGDVINNVAIKATNYVAGLFRKKAVAV